jgi:pilus assembly protein CpaF
MHVQILIQADDGTQRTELCSAQGTISIGRHPQCSLRLDSDLVSRQHAMVQVIPNGLRVEDVSTNGTIAGDQLLRRDMIDVPFGTPIVVGDFTLQIYPAEAASKPLPPTKPPGPMPQNGAAPPQMTRGPMAPTMAVAAALTGSNPAIHPSGMTPAAHGPAMTPHSGVMQSPMHGHSGVMPNPMTPPAMGLGSPSGQLPVPTIPGLRRNEPRADVQLRREIHRMLLEHLDLATIDPKKLDDPSMRPKVLNALKRIVAQLESRIPRDQNHDQLIGELADEALGLGPLERFLSDPSITEIMVVDPNTIYIEKGGKIILSEARFTDDERVRAVIERIVTPLGRRIDESSPLVDARLKDGSRVNAVIRPIALRGCAITIRKFSKIPLTLEKLYGFGALTPQMGQFLCRCVHAKRNIVISGGTGSGKTTLLNILSSAIPPEERIVTIEDAAELQLNQPHVVSLETRPANLEGRGEYTIRDLVRNALRMRPDRIVVGECRGGEALDMLQAMNTGHDGSLTTTHANSPEEAVARLETLVLMAGVDLPVRAIREQIASSVHLIVQQARLSDGSRKITAITEVVGLEDGEVQMRPIFQFVRTGTGARGKVEGEFRATGYLPSFLNDFIVMGLVKRGEPYL